MIYSDSTMDFLWGIPYKKGNTLKGNQYMYWKIIQIWIVKWGWTKQCGLNVEERS